jgi:glycosyltransferase involved in cell wall biosynthesis
MRGHAQDQSAAGVLIVAPIPPPYGGMALQAGLLQRMLRADGIPASVLGYNQRVAPKLPWIESVPGLRTFARTVAFGVRFWRQSRTCEVVHILACSWLYFFVVVSPAIVIGRLRGRRVVLNYRGGDADRFLQRCAWLVRPFFGLGSVLTAPSEFLARVIRRHLNMPVEIVPNIVDFSIFRYRKRSPFRPKVVVTRHLEKLYGVETVLRAFRQIQAGYPEASLRIAGSGAEETYLRKLSADWNLQNVQFLGYIDHKGLPDVYDQCDILLNGSHSDNFPGSLMEASAAGLVVVSTNAGGIPFLYQNGENALLVEVGDWQGMAAAVERLLQDQGLASRLAAAGREVSSQCEWSGVRRPLFKSYGVVVPEKEFEVLTHDRPLTHSRSAKEGL